MSREALASFRQISLITINPPITVDDGAFTHPVPLPNLGSVIYR